jgi:hypothetical protein
LRENIRSQTKTTESVRLLEHCHRQIEVILYPMMERSSSTFLEYSFCGGCIYMNVLRRQKLLLGRQSYI